MIAGRRVPCTLCGRPTDPHLVHPLRAAARRLRAREGSVGCAYRQLGGTSFATPAVSSVTAALLETNPGLAPHDVTRFLVTTAEKVLGVETRRQGHGVRNPGPALPRVLRLPGGAPEGLPLSGAREGDQIVFLFHAPPAGPLADSRDTGGESPGGSAAPTGRMES